ncbi:MAG: polyribonucleotide nucleotidyltransferase, partial [Candidatus Harrisonbacteria bacterium RIFCSPHIGHO2_02_FULL_40_20]
MELNRKQFKHSFRGKELVLETSKLVGQANASVFGSYNGNTVLVTVVMSKEDANKDYLPLVVDYEERFYAVGKILGSRFMRREGRPSEAAILSGRVIDRTIRPLFDQRMRREIQVAVTILEMADLEDLDFLSLVTASAALATSNVPWGGPVAGVSANSEGFKAFVAGTDERINMIELEGVGAKESDVVSSFEQAQKEIGALIDFQNKLVKEIGQKKEKVALAEIDADLAKKVRDFLKNKLEEAVYNKKKSEQYAKIGELKEFLKTHLIGDGVEPSSLGVVEHLFEEEIDKLVHKKILEEEKRPDGRKLDEVRELHAELGMLKRTHGSALFIRGDTQALVVTTLATPGTEQLVETIEFSGKRRFMLHYNFPPYSTGEIGRFGAPGRREIGHGALAEKALRGLVPPQAEFPYTIRVVSEILSSNGSSSMATVCGASLSLMEAGVPLKQPVAGIAMGLMIDDKGDKYKVLTDIQGPEDHYGDMDFKVAGTKDGVTAIQMDVKINGITPKMLADGLAQAKKARLEILEVMNKAIAAPKKEVSDYAPKILILQIRPDQIGQVIGSGGKVINDIIDRTGATIDIEEDGKVFIGAVDKAAAESAYKEVEAIVHEYQVGDIVEGRVVKIMDFGAIVEFGNRDGMIHVSELKEGFVKKVEDVVKMGD